MEPVTLDYAKRPERRIVRLAAIVAATVLLLGGLLYWRTPIHAYLLDRYCLLYTSDAADE